jgi:CheY-like chemotaxis protein
MDVQMPVLDGYQATRCIRTELGLVDLPIIALTAGALSSERQLATSAGMDDFIIKPFDARTLTTNIQRHVKISSLQSATPIAMLAQPRPPSAISWPTVSGIDLTDARMRLCDDLGLFRSSLKRLLDEFSDVSIPQPADPEALVSQAARMHKLSGSAGALGANAIQQLAVDARSACIAGDAAHAGRFSAALGEQLQRLRRSAAPFLEASRVQSEKSAQAAQAALPGDAALEAQQWDELIGLTHQKSLAALQRFTELEPQLRRHFGADFDILQDHIDNLRFTEAAQMLRDAQASVSACNGSPSSVSRTLSSNKAIANGFSSKTVCGLTTPCSAMKSSV